MQIFNSLSKQKDTLTPIQEQVVKMYVCGMTTYDFCHLGHARVLVVFDMVYRYLKSLGYQVIYVRNITDIDDKIIHRANQNQESIQALTERFIDAMHEDCEALNILPPSFEPKATDNIPQMIAMIERLIEKGFAYHAPNGDVYYHIKRFASYGKLSGKNIDELQAGERVELDASKQNPLDFVLWKSAKANEPHWESPWGIGRPGWHIECSAMSQDILGDHFDIHGGGHDLQFPHHENEIAQSEACIGHPHVNIWMHNGFIRIDDEKMSKSLNNTLTIRDLLQTTHPETLRFLLLSSHYRSPVNFAQTQIDAAKTALDRLYTAIDNLNIAATNHMASTETHKDLEQSFHQAMQDDFNTPEALAVLFKLTKLINKLKAQGDISQAESLATLLLQLSQLLGILNLKSSQWFQNIEQGPLSTPVIEDLIAQRQLAKKEKNWMEADRIRDQLNAQGIQLEDRGDQCHWKYQS